MNSTIYDVPHNTVLDKLLWIPHSEIEKLYTRNPFSKWKKILKYNKKHPSTTALEDNTLKDILQPKFDLKDGHDFQYSVAYLLTHKNGCNSCNS